MRSRRRLPWYKQIWWDNIGYHFKKPFIISIIILCIIAPLGYLGNKGYNWLKEVREVEEYNKIWWANYEKEQAQLKAKRKAEYESWKSNPNNGYEITKRQVELQKQRKQEIEDYYKNRYKVGDKIIVLDLDYYIPYGDSYTADRIDVDVVREIKDNGIIVGDCGTYSRDYIRKPFSKSEYRELLNKKLSGQLLSVREEINSEE